MANSKALVQGREERQEGEEASDVQKKVTRGGAGAQPGIWCLEQGQGAAVGPLVMHLPTGLSQETNFLPHPCGSCP